MIFVVLRKSFYNSHSQNCSSNCRLHVLLVLLLELRMMKLSTLSAALRDAGTPDHLMMYNL